MLENSFRCEECIPFIVQLRLLKPLQRNVFPFQVPQTSVCKFQMLAMWDVTDSENDVCTAPELCVAAPSRKELAQR